MDSAYELGYRMVCDGIVPFLMPVEVNGERDVVVFWCDIPEGEVRAMFTQEDAGERVRVITSLCAKLPTLMTTTNEET